MLAKSPQGPSIVVCSTCRVSREERTDAGGTRGGALMLDILQQAIAEHPCRDALSIESMPCLFACQRFCTVHLRAPGKVGYVLGDFRANVGDARALLDYAHHYVASEEGVVDWEKWPEGVKGHFIVRTPPEGFTLK